LSVPQNAGSYRII